KPSARSRLRPSSASTPRSADERQRFDDAAAIAPERLDLLRDRHDRLRGLRLRLRGDDGCAGVALLAQRRIEWHRAEQRNTELAREILAATAAEDVAGHVLDDAEQAHVRLLRHRGGTRRHVLRELLWRRHDHDL